MCDHKLIAMIPSSCRLLCTHAFFYCSLPCAHVLPSTSFPSPLQLAHDHPDSLCLGLFGRVGGADSLVSGRFLAILGENVCSTKWKQGTLAQSNFRRMANAMPISRMVEWVDSVTFPLQPPFTSGDDTRNQPRAQSFLTSSSVST